MNNIQFSAIIGTIWGASGTTFGLIAAFVFFVLGAFCFYMEKK